MKKLRERLVSLALVAVAISTSLPFSACNEQEPVFSSPLKISIDALEGNFNPFFATLASDCEIVKQTQISMLTTDATGKFVCGEKQPTVALSYKESLKKGDETTTSAQEATSTEYEFVIKNGIKFSDGTPLTIKDVLFNLYVYLDPMYTGPATVSSTKIQGLNAYRWQDSLASDEADINAGEEMFYAEAERRITNVLRHLSNETAATDEIEADIAFIKQLFGEKWNEISTDTLDTLALQIQALLAQEEARNTLREELATVIRLAYYENLKEENGGLLVKTISGITTTTKIVDDEEHDVLKITTNGVDAEAICNFAFPVAPMHYYAGEEYAERANGVDYFGVEYSDKQFFQNVLQTPEKNALPVGAGAYQASNAKGETTGVDGDEFYDGSWVYFTRNNHFKTVVWGSNNAKIKNLWYKILPNDKILDALINNEIYVGSLNATPDNIVKARECDDLESISHTTNVYGYVGINPKTVPDIEVRQAIMKAIDTALIMRSEYSGELAEIVHRAISVKSWAYPKVDDKNVGRHKKVKFSRDAGEICALVESAGYRRAEQNGVYVKDGKPLKFTFTLVNERETLPVYTMLTDAAEWLNENCGFDITVRTDMQADSKLVTGALQVWATTRLLESVPDLYSVYHKASTATSVKNWGYPTILADTTGQFTYEKDVINQLSAKIETGRRTINRTERTKIYTEALNLIMELCVELPVYQERQLTVYNKKLINSSTINKRNASPTLGVFGRIWEVAYR